MVIRIESITFESADPYRLAQFWSQLTGAVTLAFARTQLTEQARPGRFGPAQIVAEQAPAIERLVAFLGRPVNTGR